MDPVAAAAALDASSAAHAARCLEAMDASQVHSRVTGALPFAP